MADPVAELNMPRVHLSRKLQARARSSREDFRRIGSLLYGLQSALHGQLLTERVVVTTHYTWRVLDHMFEHAGRR